jgi:hypothetical protein
MEMSTDKDAGEKASLAGEPKTVLFANAHADSMTIGVVCEAEPSSLALLAAGVAGLAARRARRERKPERLPVAPGD